MTHPLIAPKKQQVSSRHRRHDIGQLALDRIGNLRIDMLLRIARTNGKHLPAPAAFAAVGEDQSRSNHGRADGSILQYAEIPV